MKGSFKIENLLNNTTKQNDFIEIYNEVMDFCNRNNYFIDKEEFKQNYDTCYDNLKEEYEEENEYGDYVQFVIDMIEDYIYFYHD